MTALNPVLTVDDQIGEALYLHNEEELSQKEITSNAVRVTTVLLIWNLLVERSVTQRMNSWEQNSAMRKQS